MLCTASHPLAFEPCIPTSADRPPTGPGWVHEIKHDGFRLIARRDGAGVRLLTRNGHDFSERYPAVADAVGRLHCRSCIIDGEVVMLDDEGRAVFDLLQRGPKVKPDAILFAFDLLELDGQDLKREPLLTRKATLLSLLKGASYGILYNEHMEGDGTMIFRHACKIVPGRPVIPSRRGAIYASGRPERLGREFSATSRYRCLSTPNGLSDSRSCHQLRRSQRRAGRPDAAPGHLAAEEDAGP
jgi:bifunctional non-homologous end joining protein LigD